MHLKLKIAYRCHLAAGLALAAWGIMYLIRSEFLPATPRW